MQGIIKEAEGLPELSGTKTKAAEGLPKESGMKIRVAKGLTGAG